MGFVRELKQRKIICTLQELLSEDFTHALLDNLGDDYIVRMEEDDPYPPLEPLSKDFTNYENIWVVITESECRKMICTLH